MRPVSGWFSLGSLLEVFFRGFHDLVIDCFDRGLFRVFVEFVDDRTPAYVKKRFRTNWIVICCYFGKFVSSFISSDARMCFHFV